MKAKILDHGYIEVIEHWGSDERIIEAARMSTNKSFKGWGNEENPGDEKLLKYLYEHKHSTPFEMCGMTIEVQAPIFVFREWHRHRTQSYSELSARYTPIPDENYVPTIERCMVVDEKNRQAGKISKADALTRENAEKWLKDLNALYEHAQLVYSLGLRKGIPKELARLCVPVGRYSRMRASANLRNWLGFLTLRMQSDAQEEIRLYANAVGEAIKERFPRTWELFAKGRGTE